MKLTNLHVDGFGVWTGLEVDKLPDDMTVFYGRNEAGKTTLMQFVRTMLYGFAADRRRRYFPPVHGGQAGGSLQVAGSHGLWQIERHTAAHDSNPLGSASVRSGDGVVRDETYLRTLLTGVDESIFNNVFAVGLRELQELATLNDTEAAEQLYRLTSGLDRVSLVDVMRELGASKQRLLSSSGEPSRITKLLEQRSRLRAEIEQLSSQSRRWAQAAAEHKSIELELANLQAGFAPIERRARLVELAIQIRDRWESRRRLNKQIAELAPLPKLPENAIEQLDQLNARISLRREKLGDTKRQRTLLREEAASLPINRRLWSQAARIEALGEHKPWIASLESQIERLQGDISSLDGELGTQQESMGLPTGGVTKLPDLSPRTLSVLRTPTNAMRQASTQLDETRQQHDEARRRADQLQLELETELAKRGEKDLTSALEQTGERVSRIRRRIQLEQRIERMGRTREELVGDVDELLDQQGLPVWVLMALGIPFVLGAMLILAGLFWPIPGVIGWTVAALGLAAWLVAGGMKIWLERSASQELSDCNKQLESLRDQLKQAKDERDVLDRQLPPGGGSLDSRLQTAEAELRALEELLPLDRQRQTATQEAEAAEIRVAQADEAVGEARNHWRRSLRSVGLPEAFTPKHVRDLSKRSAQTTQLFRHLQSRQSELFDREQELSALCERIAEVLSDVGLQSSDDDPQTQLRRLTEALNEQRKLVDRRGEIVRKHRLLRREQARYERNIEGLLRRRGATFAAGGVNDEAGYRRLAAELARAAELRRQRDEVAAQIAAAIGRQYDEQELTAELDAGGTVDLERRWEQLLAQLEQSQTRVAELHERRGELTHEMKALVDNRRLAEAKFELGCVDAQLQQDVARWRVLAVVGRMLESIREVYEQHRQPETLQEASRYLQQLSDGQYVRVWTPLGENALRVDDAHGHSLSIELLSCGTREAIFLSLRLALIASYARRGAALPVVLDDVLVNLDAHRAKAAAKVLRDFAAKGHQVLLFTCHDHILKIFKNAKVAVRRLPNHEDVARSPMTVADDDFGDAPSVEEETPLIELTTPPLLLEDVPVEIEVAPPTREQVFVEAAINSAAESDEREEINYELEPLAGDDDSDDSRLYEFAEIDESDDFEDDLRVAKDVEEEREYESVAESVSHAGTFSSRPPEMWWEAADEDAA